jgi:hypothetical protein
MSFVEMWQLLLSWMRARNAGVTGNPLDALAKMMVNQTYLGWVTEARVSTESSLYQTTQALGDTLITDVPVDFLTMVNFRIMQRGSDTGYRRTLDELTPDEMDRRFINRDATPNTGVPTVFCIRRTSSPKETGDATTLNVVSTSTLDSGAVAAFVSIVGYPNALRDRDLHQQVRLNGTTNVSVTTPIRTLISFSKDRATTGYVQLKNGSGTVLAELMPWQRASRLVVIEPYVYPDASYTYEMRYNRRPPIMLNDADTPFYVPEEFHMGLVYGAAAEFGASYIDDTRLKSVNELAAQFKRRFMMYRRSKDVVSGGFKWR